MLAGAFEFARAPWDDQHPAESVRVTTERYFDFYDRNRALMGVIVELAQTDPDVREIWRKSRQSFYTRIAHALSRGAATGMIRDDIDAEVAADLSGSMTEVYPFQRCGRTVGSSLMWRSRSWGSRWRSSWASIHVPSWVGSPDSARPAAAARSEQKN